MWISIVYVYIHKRARPGGLDLGVCSPRKNFEIRCSEIGSEVILGQKQSHSNYIARGVLDRIFGSSETSGPLSNGRALKMYS